MCMGVQARADALMNTNASNFTPLYVAKSFTCVIL